MAKDQRAPSATRFRAERLPTLFKSMGIEDNPFLRLATERHVRELAEKFWSEPRISSYHKQLQGYVDALRKSQELGRKLAPIYHSIAEARFLRNNPHLDKDFFASVVADSDQPSSVDELHTMQEDLAGDIEFLICRGGDYRKRLTTKLVVEPFLSFLHDFKVERSKKMPRSRMIVAVFDVLELEPRDRVSDVTVRNAERRLKHKKPSSV